MSLSLGGEEKQIEINTIEQIMLVRNISYYWKNHKQNEKKKEKPRKKYWINGHKIRPIFRI